MKYDNDGYPDLPKEAVVTIPRAQHEAYEAAAKALPGAERVIGDLKGRDVWREYDAVCNALHALRKAGIPIKGEGGTNP
jgi:cytochrome c5